MEKINQPPDKWFPLSTWVTGAATIGVLFGCFARKIDGDFWFTWCFFLIYQGNPSISNLKGHRFVATRLTGCSRLDSRLENGRNWAFAEGGAGAASFWNRSAAPPGLKGSGRFLRIRGIPLLSRFRIEIHTLGSWVSTCMVLWNFGDLLGDLAPDLLA